MTEKIQNILNNNIPRDVQDDMKKLFNTQDTQDTLLQILNEKFKISDNDDESVVLYKLLYAGQEDTNEYAKNKDFITLLKDTNRKYNINKVDLNKVIDVNKDVNEEDLKLFIMNNGIIKINDYNDTTKQIYVKTIDKEYNVKLQINDDNTIENKNEIINHGYGYLFKNFLFPNQNLLEENRNVGIINFNKIIHHILLKKTKEISTVFKNDEINNILGNIIEILKRPDTGNFFDIETIKTKFTTLEEKITNIKSNKGTKIPEQFNEILKSPIPEYKFDENETYEEKVKKIQTYKQGIDKYIGQIDELSTNVDVKANPELIISLNKTKEQIIKKNREVIEDIEKLRRQRDEENKTHTEQMEQTDEQIKKLTEEIDNINYENKFDEAYDKLKEFKESCGNLTEITEKINIQSITRILEKDDTIGQEQQEKIILMYKSSSEYKEGSNLNDEKIRLGYMKNIFTSLISDEKGIKKDLLEFLDKYKEVENKDQLKEIINKSDDSNTFTHFDNSLTDLIQEACKLEDYNVETLIRNQINNFKEDLRGGIRIYVRINLKTKSDLTAKKEIEEETNVKVIKNNQVKIDNTKYPSNKEFFYVFDKDYKNKCNTPPPNCNDIFTNTDVGLRNLAYNIKLGRSIIYFGYGFSGSGKTYTLLGADGTPGLLSSYFDYFKENTIQIFLYSVYEIYGKSYFDELYDKTNTSLYSYNKDGEMDPYIISDVNYKKWMDKNIITNKKINEYDELNSILKSIEKKRIEKGHIKPTPNNPDSSRGHLFITLKIGGGYLTICDMAGIEDPVAILKSNINGSPGISTETIAGECTNTGVKNILTVKNNNDILPVKLPDSIINSSIYNEYYKKLLNKKTVVGKDVFTEGDKSYSNCYKYNDDIKNPTSGIVTTFFYNQILDSIIYKNKGDNKIKVYSSFQVDPSSKKLDETNYLKVSKTITISNIKKVLENIGLKYLKSNLEQKINIQIHNDITYENILQIYKNKEIKVPFNWRTIMDVIPEGIFINESLHQLLHYLNFKQENSNKDYFENYKITENNEFKKNFYPEFKNFSQKLQNKNTELNYTKEERITTEKEGEGETSINNQIIYSPMISVIDHILKLSNTAKDDNIPPKLVMLYLVRGWYNTDTDTDIKSWKKGNISTIETASKFAEKIYK